MPLYHELGDLGLQKFDFGTFFKGKSECHAAIVDTTHDPHGVIVGVRLLNELSLTEIFRSGFLHWVDGKEVSWFRLRVDTIRFSPVTHEQSFIITGHVDPEDWEGKTPDGRTHTDIGYKQPPTMSSSFFYDLEGFTH